MSMLGGIRNPFLKQILADPWDRVDSDVPAFHQGLLEQAVDLIAAVQLRGTSSSLVIEGEAGCGKTHFASRFRSYIQDREEALFFFSVPMDTVAGRIWRRIRRCVVADLLRQGPRGATMLSRLVGQRDLAGTDASLSYNLATVLGHYRADHYRTWCVAWLKGDPLPEKTAAKLELTPPESGPGALEKESRQIVFELCRLASPAVAIICFERVEALELSTGDSQGLQAFARVFDELYTDVGNALILTCAQPPFLRGLPPDVAARIAEHRARLEPLGQDGALTLLKQAMDTEPQLAHLRTRNADHPLWPLPANFLEELYSGESALPARRALAEACAAFDSVRGPAAAGYHPPETAEFLDAEYAARIEATLAARSGEATDSDTAFLAGLPVLLAMQGRGGQCTPSHPAIDFVVETPGAPIAVCLVNQEHEPAVSGRLREIGENWNAREFARLRLVRDASLPFHGGSKPALEALKALRSRGAKLVRPSVEALAALEAVRSLYADARSGSLAAQNGTPVEAGSITEWLTQRTPSILQELSGEVMETGSEDTQFAGGLLEFLHKKSIVKLEDAADAVGATAEEVAAYARSHPSRIGYLAGPPQVLFHPVAATAWPEAPAD